MRGLFDISAIPRMARPNYLVETRHILLWGVFVCLVDGSFSSIIATKTFGASRLLNSIVWSTPMLAHVLSLVVTSLLRGRRKVAAFVTMAACALLAVSSVALTPSRWHPWGGWIFAGQIALARIFVTGLVTARTAIWRANYPASHRARIAGRIQFVQSLLFLLMTIAITRVFDQHAEAYRWVYPAVAAVGLLSLLPLRRLRVRGERRELRQWREEVAGPDGPGLLHGLVESLAILRKDRAFARYCTAQYFLGSANFMVQPVLTFILARELALSYFASSFIMDQVPMIVALLTLRFSAHQFDRVGVLRFRVINSSIWLGSIAVAALAVFVLRTGGSQHAPVVWAALAILTIGRVISGWGQGGGSIAWNLGHLHFTSDHNSELYMGVHVALTGLRGILMPVIGAVAYDHLGAGSFAIAVALSITSVVLFVRLERDTRADAEKSAAGGRSRVQGATPRDSAVSRGLENGTIEAAAPGE